MSDVIEVSISSIKLRDDLYPRLNKNPEKVQAYSEDLEVLPPIEINQNNELIDGWHRWTAYKKNDKTTIPVIITETHSDAELLEFAIERNSKHGMQLTRDDKQDVARKIYHATPEKEREAKKKTLAKILSVSDRTVRDWLSRIDKDDTEKRNRNIFDLWMSCCTQEQIAEQVGLSHQAVALVLQETAKLPELANLQEFAAGAEGILKKILTKEKIAAAEHAIDFDTPLYNVWKFKNKTSGSSHYGNTEVTIVDNLLYLYTNPFDIVVDPFAGGGSTIDICKKRLRRYFVSDRKPIIERQGDIRTWDITSGLPKIPRWEDVKLLYLDPPYWKQAENKYSEDNTDLANMELDEFTKILSNTIIGFGKKLHDNSYIALILQPTQWNTSKKHEYTDHVVDMIRAVKLPIDMRFQCPYEPQQCNAQMVEWAKENRKTLVLSRELVVWKV